MGRSRQDLLARLALHRRELRAWALYDWANSTFVTTIVTAVFPIYYASVACAGMAASEATLRFGLVSTLGLAVVAAAAPFLGALADVGRLKKRLLSLFLALGLTSVSLMFLIQSGNWLLASVLFVLANIGANGSFVFYDSLLPHVARPEEMDRISTTGYALGYVGGGLLLALNLLWIQKPGWFGLPSGPSLSAAQATLPSRLAFLSVAAWWGLFSLPLLRHVPEPPSGISGRLGAEPAGGAGRTLVAATWRQWIDTFRSLRLYRQAVLMLAAFLLYNDGIGTIVRMATIYGTEIGIGRGALISAVLLVQFIGIPCALLFGALAGRIGARPAIYVGLSIYIVVSFLAYFMKSARDFYALAILVGVAQGGTQALSRSLFASMIPRSRSGEFFGFFAVAEKAAGILGPALFSLTIALTGSSRRGILSVLVFFVAGGIVLRLVKVEEGRRAAEAAP